MVGYKVKSKSVARINVKIVKSIQVTNPCLRYPPINLVSHDSAVWQQPLVP
jgi:hypothetical protein